MAKQIFLSYSSPDKAKADVICHALEAAGMSCWIAPRDLSAGTQWGGGIVKAIEECTAVVVVFSEAANNSPQVAREMEIAVSKRKPLVPVRVADAQPTDDMHYFLGVSHWFNAYQSALESYLPDILVAVRRVMEERKRPWTQIRERLPRSQAGTIAIVAGGAVLLALLVAWLMRPSTATLDGLRSPFAGRWETSIPDGRGGTADCQIDVQDLGQASFADSCPSPFTGSMVSINAIAGSNVAAPKLFKSGDDGTFTYLGGSAHNIAGAYRFGWFGKLTTRDDTFGELHWKKIANDEPMKSGMDDIVTEPVAWPLTDVPGIAHRARDYVRSHWQQDAELISVKAELAEANSGGANIRSNKGPLQLSLEFYSPGTQKGLYFQPKDASQPMMEQGVIDRSARDYLPEDFVDLPTVVGTLPGRGMRGKGIKRAELDGYGSGGMPGPLWMVDSVLSERFFAPANTR